MTAPVRSFVVWQSKGRPQVRGSQGLSAAVCTCGALLCVSSSSPRFFFAPSHDSLCCLQQRHCNTVACPQPATWVFSCLLISRLPHSSREAGEKQLTVHIPASLEGVKGDFLHRPESKSSKVAADCLSWAILQLCSC